MLKLDAFTQRRLTHFIEGFRRQSGQLPTLRDFEAAGMDRDLVELGIKEEIIEQLYVTLTTGTVVKGYKVRVSSL